MAVCLDNKFPKLREEIIKVIIEDEELKNSLYNFSAFEAKDVGMSFEPRVQVKYYGCSKDELRGIYSKTFVFDKKYNFETTLDEDWIEIFK